MNKASMRLHNGRLAQFRIWNNQAEDWEEIWAKQVHAKMLQKHATGALGDYEIFVDYLPRNLPVLEAGCGQGQIVKALSVRGYTVEGVDFAERTIARIKELAPELNVRVGDIYHLDVPDGSYGGYISLGVLEHNTDGPLAGLKEARRVLHSDGVAFISIPFLNRPRRRLLKRLLGKQRRPDGQNLQFYQYYYSNEEFSKLLQQAGFTVIKSIPFGVIYWFTQDLMIGRWLMAHGFFHKFLRKLISTICFKLPKTLQWQYSHMVLYIAKGEG